jgi:arylsulfatase A-like enzyme
MIKILSLLFVLALFAGEAKAQEKKEKPYNVLFVAIDDLNDYVSLLQNHPGLKTPNLDRFAKSAVTFTHAYAPAPVCNPSRAAVLTGKSPVNTGIYENSDFWENSTQAMAATLLPEHLKKNGYRTMWSGKLFHTRPGDNRMDAMWDDKEGADGGYGPFPQKDPSRQLSGFFSYQAWEGPDQDFSDIINGDITIKRLQQQDEKPFFIAYGLYRPHNPWTAPKRFFDMYPLDEVQLPQVLENDLDDIPAVGREWVKNGARFEHLKRINEWKPIVRSYLASISFMDYSLGRVLDALDNGPHRDNTIVLIWADHGFHLGEKHHFTKFALWEQTTHTLLMARIPGRKGGELRDQPVNLLDLYPTLVDYCKLPAVPFGLDGISLRPVIEDAGYTREQPSMTYFIKGSVGMRSKDWRYIRYHDGGEELYNSKKDPKEWHNLAGDKNHREVVANFQKWLPEKMVEGVGRGKQSGKPKK